MLASLLVAAADSPELLASMDTWQQLGGAEGSFKLQDGQLNFVQAGNEPAALLTRECDENFEFDSEFKFCGWVVSRTIAKDLFLVPSDNKE